MKTQSRILFIALLLLTALNAGAQTFVKEIFGIGNIQPKVFDDPNSTDYFITTRTNDSTIITKLDAAGNIMGSHILHINGDQATITDMIVDNIDGTLAGVARGTSRNYIFKYDFNSFSFNWVNAYPSNYIFENIHQVSATNYVVTGEILTSQITIFQVNRFTGATGYQRAGFVGEFLSTFDGTDIYGACRYYSSGSLFTPSLYRFNTGAGTNTWTRTYITNPPTVTSRIYPVAPIVDGGRIMQLSSGDDVGFNTYLTGTTDAWLLQTDLAGGLVWTRNITIPGHPRLNAKKIINTATGYYLLIDSYNGSINDFFFVVKTDKFGNLQWINRYGISGINTVLSGVEDNGDLYLTALSGSYTPGSNVLYLKLDPNGLSDPNCPYITPWKANIINYAPTQLARPTTTNPTNYVNNPPPFALDRPAPSDVIHCSTGSGILPCNTLTGSLATGVVAFYPFGNGSLLDLSGNNNHLTGGSAVTTPDRIGNPNCAYRFNKVNGDFLTAATATFVDNMTTSPFSISLWYQPLDPTRPVGDYELLIGRGNTGLHCPDTWGEWSVGLYDCKKAVVGFDMNSHWETPATILTCQQYLASITNLWHHLAFIHDGAGQYDLYIDGVLYSNIHGPCGWMSGNIGPLMLGVDYTGDLDDIVLYNRVLSPAEVNALMNQTGVSCCDGVSSSNKSSTNVNDNVKLADAGALNIYPNPASGEVTISAGKNIIKSVALYSNTGALVGHYNFDKAKVSVDIAHLAPGVYFIKVTTDSGTSTERLVKE